MVQGEDKITTPTNEEVEKYAAAATDDSRTPPADADSIESLQRELADCRDKLLRAQAECANISKRLHQQHAESMKLASMGLARDVLNVVDSFGRSLEGLKAAGADVSVLEGVRLIAEQLEKVLRDHGVEPIHATGKPFDPTQHEALMPDYESPEPPGTVTAELVRGYTMHGRVLRPARVTVAAKKPESPESSAQSGDDGQEANADGRRR